METSLWAQRFHGEDAQWLTSGKEQSWPGDPVDGVRGQLPWQLERLDAAFGDATRRYVAGSHAAQGSRHAPRTGTP
jgi:hypothetical protein